MKMARGFDDVPDNTGYDSVRLEEIVDLWLPSKEAASSEMDIRILPHSMLPIKTHWISIQTKKGEIRVPRVCVSFNPDNQSEPLDGRECPYCKLDHTKDTGVASSQIYYYANAIVRDEQQNEPANRRAPTKEEAKTGVKDMNSKTWTPVRVVQLTGGVGRKLKEMANNNKAKIKGESKAFPVNHEKFGVDISIKFNPKASGEAKYSIDKTERTPLTEEEKEYLYFDLEDAEGIYDKIGRLDTKAAVKDLKGLKINGSVTDDEEDDDDGYKAKKRKPSDDSEEDDGFKPKRKSASKFNDDEDEEEEKPKRRRKPSDESDEEEPAPKRKRKPADASDSSDEEKPKRRRKPADDSDDEAPPSRRRKPVDDEDDEEPAPKRRRKPAPVDEDDEEPAPKRKRKPVDDEDDEPAPKRKRKTRFDEDDE
jgi:hypothetical protein